MELDELADRCAEIPGVVAVVLGGSRARGTERADSDTDIGLFYRDGEPLDVGAARALAAALDPAAPEVTDLYGWGPWVNGGAWLDIPDYGRVDFLYRSVEQVERTLLELHRGERQHHWPQQPPFGFASVIYGGEVRCCVPLRDDNGVVAALKRHVDVYPGALRRRIVQDDLASSSFTLAHARKLAFRNDAYGTLGCLTRSSSLLVQVLFALNGEWFVNDKGALDAIDAFDRRPSDFGSSVAAVLAGAVGLIERVEAMATVQEEVERLAGDLYVRRR